MKTTIYGCLLIGLWFSVACTQKATEQETPAAIADQFVEAFYSFDRARLESVAAEAGESLAMITYYQGWAQGGNYKVITRHPYVEKNDSVLICPVTVEDDLIKALQLDIHVTDSFHLTIVDGAIRFIKTSSNDPDLFRQAMDWVNENKTDEIAVPCEGIGGEGKTPGDCCKAFVKGFAEFRAQLQETGSGVDP